MIKNNNENENNKGKTRNWPHADISKWYKQCYVPVNYSQFLIFRFVT